jgi:hypothetical protein
MAVVSDAICPGGCPGGLMCPGYRFKVSRVRTANIEVVVNVPNDSPSIRLELISRQQQKLIEPLNYHTLTSRGQANTHFYLREK